MYILCVCMTGWLLMIRVLGLINFHMLVRRHWSSVTLALVCSERSFYDSFKGRKNSIYNI